MKSFSIIITKPPFGTVHAAEAIRLANGAVTYGHDVSVVLVGDGILVAKRGQMAESSGWTSLSPLVEKLATGAKKARVLADIDGVRQIGLSETDLVAGVKLVESKFIASTVLASEKTVTF